MVYISPRSPERRPSSPPGRKPTCSPRKAFEVFEDRIFQDKVTSVVHPSTPSKRLRAFKSVQSLSAPAKSLRHCKTSRDLVDRAGNAVPHPPNEPSVLRRHKTFQDLRSETGPCSDLESSKKLCMGRAVLKPHQGYSDANSNVASGPSLESHPHRKQTRASDSITCQLPVRAVSIRKASVPTTASGNFQSIARRQPTDNLELESIKDSASETIPKPSSESKDDGKLRNEDYCSVRIRNLNDSIQRPDDFFKPVIRSDPEVAGDIYNPIRRIDITTSWLDLSSANAEDLFYIHTIFKDALSSILGEDVRHMCQTIQQDFVRRKGKFTYIDGFRVAVDDQWIFMEREQLIQTMTEKGHDFFSNSQCQPNRSALMQLYLSSTDCFFNCEQTRTQGTKPGICIALRTCYDQLSRFELPSCVAGSFCDYVELVDLNYVPHEDEILLLIPRYKRDGVFVQSSYPEGVRYTMENPVQWLNWDSDINGFRGRVPTYSAFPDRFGYPGAVSAVSHVLDITIVAIFTKYCSTGAARFERKVRTRLTLGVLPKISWSVKNSVRNSVYGAEYLHSLSSTPILGSAREPLANPTQSANYENKHSKCHVSSSHDSASDSLTHKGHIPRHLAILTLPKRVPETLLPMAFTSSQSEDEVVDSKAQQKKGSTAYPPQHRVDSATTIAPSQASANNNTTFAACGPVSNNGEATGNNHDCPEWIHEYKKSCREERKVTEHRLIRNSSDMYMLTPPETPVESIAHSDEAREPDCQEIYTDSISVGNLASHDHRCTQKPRQVEYLEHPSLCTDGLIDSEPRKRHQGIDKRCFESTDSGFKAQKMKQNRQWGSTHQGSKAVVETAKSAKSFDDLAAPSSHQNDEIRYPIPSKQITLDPIDLYKRELERFKLDRIYLPSSGYSSQASSSICSENGSPTDQLVFKMSNLNIDDDTSAYVNFPDPISHAFRPHAIKPKVCLDFIGDKNSFARDRYGRAASPFQTRTIVEERLALDEEIALQKAIERSREEEVLRKMATQGFQASFDDIFVDDSTVEQTFEDENSFCSDGIEESWKAKTGKESKEKLETRNEEKTS